MYTIHNIPNNIIYTPHASGTDRSLLIRRVKTDNCNQKPTTGSNSSRTSRSTMSGQYNIGPSPQTMMWPALPPTMINRIRRVSARTSLMCERRRVVVMFSILFSVIINNIVIGIFQRARAYAPSLTFWKT